MLEAIIAGAVVLLLIAGFWWTRGAGGMPGGLDDPARQQLSKYAQLGDPIPKPSADAEDREHEVE